MDATSRIYILFMVSSKAFIFYRLFFHLQEPVISADEIIFLALQLLQPEITGVSLVILYVTCRIFP